MLQRIIFQFLIQSLRCSETGNGLVKAPTNWEYLSFHRHMREGLYEAEWGVYAKMEFKLTIGGE